MVFSSITFLIYFLPILLIVYHFSPWKLKNSVLLLASLLFYAWGEPVYVLLMMFSILINFLFGLWIGQARTEKLDVKTQRFHLVMAVSFNLSILIFFKYINFILSGFGLVFGTELKIANLELPIGISFYTFQTLSYIIDVYKGNVAANKSMGNFALYITSFPQLIAGPIVRYVDIESQLEKRKVTLGIFGRGTELFVTGLAKKVLIANQLGAIFEAINAYGEKTFILAWLAAISYTLQLYFDFSGYSDMAMGLGYMFGFKFPKNFDYPYIAGSVTDFWRRWHITLSSWFREYVYIPLGGNRVSKGKHIRNILIVWALTGIWHGAHINFLLWGLYYAMFLIVEKYILKDFLDRHKALAHIYTGIVFIFGWVIFAYTDFSMMWSTIKGMLFMGGFINKASLYFLKISAIPLVLAIFCATPVPFKYKKKLMPNAVPLVVGIDAVLLILCIAGIVFGSYNPFLYFRF